mmetsp:Transcript_50182/g.162448  ORF Transcript_50182/g.162448 Transcript_50182/m.162448 type:complete len:240 (+) Transcript_50182:3634-4353(+)
MPFAGLPRLPGARKVSAPAGRCSAVAALLAGALCAQCAEASEARCAAHPGCPPLPMAVGPLLCDAHPRRRHTPGQVAQAAGSAQVPSAAAGCCAPPKRCARAEFARAAEGHEARGGRHPVRVAPQEGPPSCSAGDQECLAAPGVLAGRPGQALGREAGGGCGRHPESDAGALHCEAGAGSTSSGPDHFYVREGKSAVATLLDDAPQGHLHSGLLPRQAAAGAPEEGPRPHRHAQKQVGL